MEMSRETVLRWYWCYTVLYATEMESVEDAVSASYSLQDQESFACIEIVSASGSTIVPDAEVASMWDAVSQAEDVEIDARPPDRWVIRVAGPDHHLLPKHGTASVEYLPDGADVGERITYWTDRVGGRASLEELPAWKKDRATT